MATEDEIAAAILKVGRVLNAVPEKSILKYRATSMMDARWTAAEIEAAARLIPNDAELAKEVSYGGGVTPAVFVMVVHSCAPLVWTYPVEGRHIVTYVSAGNPEEVPVAVGDIITEERRDELEAAGFDVREDISPVIHRRAS